MTTNKPNSESLETTNTSLPFDFQEPVEPNKMEPKKSIPDSFGAELKIIKVDITSDISSVPIHVDLNNLAHLEYVREMNEHIKKM